jgi:uridine kinase
MDTRNSTVTTSYQYTPPWNNVSIVGIAGSSGSGKSSLSRAILSALNLPWVAIIGLDSFYKPLNEEDHQRAHRNELDFDAPEAIDFDLVVKCLKNLKQGYEEGITYHDFC